MYTIYGRYIKFEQRSNNILKYQVTHISILKFLRGGQAMQTLQ